MITKFFKYLILFILFCSANSFAQINTEGYLKLNTEDGWYSKLDFDISLYRGNTEYIQFSPGARIDFLKNNIHSFLVGRYNYREADENVIQKNAFAHYRFLYDITSYLTGEFFLQKEFNEFTLLKDRNLVGAGARWTLQQWQDQDSSKWSLLQLGTGFMYENELLDTEPVSETDIIRSTNYLKMILNLNKILQFNSVTYYQVDVTRLNDYRILTENGLSFIFTKYLRFNVKVIYDFDNEPPPGIKKYDLQVLNGISIIF